MAHFNSCFRMLKAYCHCLSFCGMDLEDKNGSDFAQLLDDEIESERETGGGRAALPRMQK